MGNAIPSRLNKAPVIAIDGASATGKGVIGQLVAKQLAWHLLNSGALYRILALAAHKHSVALDNEKALEVLAEHLDIQFVVKEGMSHMILEGESVTDSIHSESIGRAASIVGMLPAVRRALLSRQRAFRAPPGLVAEGRDMGTVVFPDAELKIFLQASLAERARRRFNQLKEKGMHATLSALETELSERDQRDQERLTAPLKCAPDAIVIDTSHLTIDQVVARILQEKMQKTISSC